MQTDTQFDILFDKRRQKYLSEIREHFSRFLQKPKQLKTNLLLSLTSWPEESFELHQTLFNSKNSDIQEGGYFLSLQGLGICINPSGDFFDLFYKKGFSLHDIDIVLATTAQESVQEAIKRLFTLNRECSRTLMSYGQDAHIIRFFLHPELYSQVSSLFRPIIREELGAIQSLQTFTKSLEERPLADGIHLAYCNAEGQNLGIRIDCPDEDLSVGFVSSGGYASDLNELFKPCSILIAGVGHCSGKDLEKLDLQKQTLGYNGLYKLVENAPNLSLLLVSEFSRSMGDCRLELIQKLKSECDCIALPMDSELCLQLNARVVETESGTFASCEDVKVIRPNGPFSRLMFLSQEDVL